MSTTHNNPIGTKHQSQQDTMSDETPNTAKAPTRVSTKSIILVLVTIPTILMLWQESQTTFRYMDALKESSSTTTPSSAKTFYDMIESKSFAFEKSDPAEILKLAGGSTTTSEERKCPPGLEYVEDVIDPSFYQDPSTYNRKIPKIVHFTSVSRCMTPTFAGNLRDRWGGLKGHSVVLHDDDAVDKLLKKKWKEFPHLQEGLKCLVSGAAKADLWRYLMIWEYGGIYTDIDNIPGPKFFDADLNISAIEADTDALFEQETGRFPSQYFFAASPHHPVMYYTVLHTIQRLFSVENVATQYIPFVTGPGAVKSGVIAFMGGDGYPSKGVYTGTHHGDRTLTIVGDPTEAKQGQYIGRSSHVLQKGKGFDEMGIVNYESKESRAGVTNQSCFAHLYSLQKEDFEKDLN